MGKTKKSNADVGVKSPEKPAIRPELTNVPMKRTGFELANLDQAYRYAQYLAESDIVPDNYHNKPGDCLIALDLAGRLGVTWLAIMQNVYPVYGRPGMMAVLCISLINSSGLFADPLDYEVDGEDPYQEDYRVRAVATRKRTGKVLYGPWITWKLVRAEGWDKKTGSKWNTMADQMFHYRAASWFANRYCPEVKMGMMTVDEAEEIGPRHVDAKIVEPGNEGLKKLLAEREKGGNGENSDDKADGESPEEQGEEPVDRSEERDEETEAKVAAEKKKLQMTPIGASGGGTNKKSSNLF